MYPLIHIAQSLNLTYRRWLKNQPFRLQVEFHIKENKESGIKTFKRITRLPKPLLLERSKNCYLQRFKSPNPIKIIHFPFLQLKIQLQNDSNLHHQFAWDNVPQANANVTEGPCSLISGTHHLRGIPKEHGAQLDGQINHLTSMKPWTPLNSRILPSIYS